MLFIIAIDMENSFLAEFKLQIIESNHWKEIVKYIELIKGLIEFIVTSWA